MSILPHTITGAVVGSFLDNPALAFFGGVASHYLLDYIPHYDPDLRKKHKLSKQQKIYYGSVMLVDVVCSLIVLSFLFPFPNLFWGGVGGAVVDVDNFLQFKFKHFPLQRKLGITAHSEGSRWHNKLKFSPRTNLLVGVAMQSAICLAGLVYLYSLLGPLW